MRLQTAAAADSLALALRVVHRPPAFRREGVRDAAATTALIREVGAAPLPRRGIAPASAVRAAVPRRHGSGPSTLTYWYGAVSVCATSVARPAALNSRAFCDPAPVPKYRSPPTSYEYQIGTARGPRPDSSTLTMPTCTSARNCSRSARVMLRLIATPSTSAAASRTGGGVSRARVRAGRPSFEPRALRDRVAAAPVLGGAHIDVHRRQREQTDDQCTETEGRGIAPDPTHVEQPPGYLEDQHRGRQQ